MTLEEVLDCDAAKLEAMSDAELLKHFQSYLVVTRPELAAKQPRKENNHHEKPEPISPERQKKLELLASMGIDVSSIGRKKRKI